MRVSHKSLRRDFLSLSAPVIAACHRWHLAGEWSAGHRVQWPESESLLSRDSGVSCPVSAASEGQCPGSGLQSSTHPVLCILSSGCISQSHSIALSSSIIEHHNNGDSRQQQQQQQQQSGESDFQPSLEAAVLASKAEDQIQFWNSRASLPSVQSYSHSPQLVPNISSTVKLWTSSSQGRLWSF